MTKAALAAEAFGNKGNMGTSVDRDSSSGIAIITVDRDLDVTTAPGLRASIDAVIDAGCQRVVLNMAGADYVDSAGVGLLVHAIRTLRERGGLLSLVNVRERVYRTMRLAHVSDFAPVSAAGPRPAVPELPPQAQPLWRTAFQVDPNRLDLARQRVGELLARMPLTPDEAFDVTLAVGEAMGNAVDHAEGVVVVAVGHYADRVVIEVTDCGCGFELAADESVPDAGAGDERGRGIALMRLLVDSVVLCRRPSGAGTCARIVKLIRGPEAARPAQTR